jgi:hypothetical protein
LEAFQVVRLNIFEEPVFHDTTYAVCAFQFEKRHAGTAAAPVQVSIYPSGEQFTARLSASNQFLIGGEVYHLQRTHAYRITRLTRHNRDQPHTHILLKCIDDDQPIQMRMVAKHEIYVDETPHASARSYATLVVDPPLSLEQQERLVGRFNALLQHYRQAYHSLFLSNYREHQRKRITFDLAYHMAGHLLET